ncbi:MAG: hypothetical protein PHR26_01150 [Candidatus ainarchaeum sp.]|nr:hypothetical protein [Candidatus ainarchaeum sp.]MDD3976009.1 hypothetical protein [Candidatus ainarchaeum sp.]
MVLKIFLDVVLGESLVSQTTSNIFTMIPQNLFFYLFLFICFLILILVISFLIIPLFKQSPEKLYKKYICVRQNLEKIDFLHESKKISFDMYVSLQFYYAKEYEKLVKLLIKDPIYKKMLQNYKIKDNSKAEIENVLKIKNIENQNIKLINTLFNSLIPKAKFYKKEEIIQAILDEGISKDIANTVIELLEKKNIKFNSAVAEEKESKVSLFLNALFTKTTKVPLKNESNIYKLDDININSSNKISEIDTSSIDSDIQKIIPSKNKNIWKFFINIFKSNNEKNHTVSEINDIFKDIEYELNKK